MIIFDLLIGCGIIGVFIMAMSMGIAVTCVIMLIVLIIEFCKWISIEEKE